MSSSRQAEFADYAAARLPSFRRIALLLCHDRHRADDLVQAALTKLYVNWARAFPGPRHSLSLAERQISGRASH
jgi:DNA-directed RNA polymerase specialized sigma24 family protein